MLFPNDERKKNRVPLDFQKLWKEANLQFYEEYSKRGAFKDTRRLPSKGVRVRRAKLGRSELGQELGRVKSTFLAKVEESVDSITNSNNIDVEFDRGHSSPQEYFEILLEERGYNVPALEALCSGFYNKPTKLQLASHGSNVQRLVRRGDVTAIEPLFQCGLSPNACNNFGESSLHLACRRGHEDVLELMIKYNAVLQVCDDYGRTPMHDACWAVNPAFGVVEALLRRDRSMIFMQDTRGSQPLDYVHLEDWDDWKKWLDQNIDAYFPGNTASKYRYSPIATMKPDSFSFPEPADRTINYELIEMLANGRLDRSEIIAIAQDGRRAQKGQHPPAFQKYDDGHDDEEYHDYDSYDDESYCETFDDSDFLSEVAHVANASQGIAKRNHK